MSPTANILPCGARLHLRHGPIDLVIGADGDRQAAFAAAQDRFRTILNELVDELVLLRAPVTASSPLPRGSVARRMDRATRCHSSFFVTRMAAVAGAVADTILAAMCAATPLSRAYVNNGGDIALHLGQGASFTTAIADHTGQPLGKIQITARDGIGGIATSGRHGRSLSFGIADSVTVLATSAARADAAATLIANAVDLPDHPGIFRQPASELHPDSDLGSRPVVTGCPDLALTDINKALLAGQARAQSMLSAHQITSAALFLQDEARLVGTTGFTTQNRTRLYA